MKRMKMFYLRIWTTIIRLSQRHLPHHCGENLFIKLGGTEARCSDDVFYGNSCVVVVKLGGTEATYLVSLGFDQNNSQLLLNKVFQNRRSHGFFTAFHQLGHFPVAPQY